MNAAKQITAGLALALASILVLPAATADEASTEQKLRDALKADIRTDAEKARDRNRKPVETLLFFGLRDDMKVLELLPGGGWYTKVLAPTLYDEGKLYVSIGAGRLAESLLKEPGFDRVEVIETGRFGERTGGFMPLEDVDFGVDDLDMVLTFRNLHNLTESGRRAMNQAAFDALRSGGRYGVIDHTRRHMQRNNPENRRRLDPVLAIKEIQAVGFKLLDFSDLHYRADDELRYEVGRRSVTGNTDRFTLLFEKP